MSNEWPLVSIIMPIRNEAAFIRRTLEAVLAQDYPPDRLEVIIGDGESTDDTLAQIKPIVDENDHILVFSNHYRHQTYALNQAIQLAKGDIIVRVDGHSLIAPNYVWTCVHTLQRTGAHCVGGKQSAVGITLMGQAIATASTSWFSVPSQYRISNHDGPVDTVFMGAWPRSVFDRVGLFNTALIGNEDYELCYRIRKAGGLVYLSQDIQSTYFGRQHLIDLCKQYFHYGRAKCQVVHLAPDSTKPRHLAAPAFVAILSAGGLMSAFSHRIAALWKLTLSIYSLLMTLATWQSLRLHIKDADQRRAQFWRIPLVFITVHIAWGVGFIWESIRGKVSSEQ